MEYRHLGSSGLRLSELSLGSWVTFGNQIDDDLAYECALAAYDGGVNFFDTAEEYAHGNAESVLGRIIRRAGWKRSELVLSTKIFWGGSGPNDVGLSRKHIVEGLRASLARLQMNYVDLVYCHRSDPHTPIEETVRAMNYVIEEGMAFYWGTSEWSAQEIMQAFGIAQREHLLPPQMEQSEYNMFTRNRVEREYAPLCTEIGLGLTTFSPLASGLLTGKYNAGVPEGTRATLPGYEWFRDSIDEAERRGRLTKVEELASIAAEIGCTMAQLAIAWCLRNHHVSSVITGASRPEQVAENLEATELSQDLTDETMHRLEEILGNKPEEWQDAREET